MKLKKIFLIVGIILLSILGVSIFQEFMANHTYYRSMLGSRQNRKVVIRAILASVIPLRYILKAKSFSLKRFFVRILPLGLIIFSVALTIVKGGIVGGPAGFLILCVNTLLLYFLGMYFVVGALSLGTWISNKRIRFPEIRWQEMMINFGIGIGVILLLVYVLSMATILWPVITWILALGLGFMIRYMRKKLTGYTPIVVSMFETLKLYELKQKPWKWIGLILLGIAIMYYFYGFNLSFIPYSTAWDANHEYMYIPKVLAENHGVLRGNVGPAPQAPYLRHMFITFRFSLIQPIKSRFWLGADTIAVAMNFLSGIFVLIFGMGLIKEVLGFFGKKDDDEKGLSFSFGRTGLLFWLTSGMGAFLVFVDNKTDLGVMAMTILAILSGFIFLKIVRERVGQSDKLDKIALKYVIVSGILFALASMSKPTAFIDIALFGILLFALRIDIVLALGLGVMAIGATGILQINNAKDIMSTGLGKWVFLIGAVIVVIALIRLLWKNYKHIREQKKIYLKYIGVRIITLLAVLVVFKGPNMLASQINAGSFSPGTWVKSLILGSQQKQLLATTASTTALDEQAQADQTVLDQQSANLSVESCKSQTFSKDDLDKNLKKAISTNEDVGRYVGYGWKDLTKDNGLNLGYYLVRLFYPVNGVCYGLNGDAKLLCRNGGAINNFDVATLQKLFALVKKDGNAYQLLSGALAAYQAKSNTLTGAINPAEFRDEIVALRQYYQNHSIYTEAGTIHIPYRYIIPFNVVFNRSLQNLSSYYTDIGFVRLFMLVFIVMAFVYALIKKEKNLTALSGTTIIGRTIRRIIGGGIVRYGIGLIIRTILTGALFIKELIGQEGEQEKKTNNAFLIFICLFAIRAIIQLVLNFIRISSQGGGGPFLWYKMNNGKTVELNEQLQQKEVAQGNYRWKDVFDLQFPHYNKFIQYIKDRDNKDGVLIAGTYLQYFLDNQHNIKGDGMLDRFWEQTSDNNECKSYQRLRSNNIKYLVIDPNIGTVVMGEGNESLFNRFFAKLDPVTKKLQEHGAITRLVQLWKDGYINLFSTNNLGAKYAFSLSDQELQNAFGRMDADALLLLRAKIAIARFFPESQDLLNFIGQTFTQRLSNGSAIGDIADVYGKIVDENKVLTTAALMLQQDIEKAKAQIIGLSQDERLILAQYVGLVNLINAENAQYQEYLNNLLGQSLGGGSQLMVFELN